MRKIIYLFTAVTAITALFSCATADLPYAYRTDNETAQYTEMPPADFPETRFCVFSDPHTFDTALGTSGPDFAEYMKQDRKMLIESTDILKKAMSMMADFPADFVIVPGDLTKDGERVSHETFAGYLKIIEATGRPVYVVPGNHDILNPHAVRFTSEGHEKVDTVTPEDFSAIYGEYGYSEALYRDSHSLSYTAEPVEGLWLLAMDSADYENNIEDDYPQTDGSFSMETLAWIESILQEAVKKEKAVIAFMHHGIAEHYASQEKHYGEYIVDDYSNFSELLAAYNVRTVFTGHYHAQDIVQAPVDYKDKFIFDIETGSLVTYPSPVRYVEISEDQKMKISSHFVEELPGFTAKGQSLPEYSRAFLRQGIEGIAVEVMKSLKVKEEDAERAAPQIADAFIAHYQGDEKFTGDQMLTKKGMGFMGRLVLTVRKSLITGLWNDPAPSDNNIVIDLTTGDWSGI